MQAARPRGAPSERTLQDLQRKMEAAYPGYRYPLFVSNGLEAVWKAQQAGAPTRGGHAAAPAPAKAATKTAGAAAAR